MKKNNLMLALCVSLGMLAATPVVMADTTQPSSEQVKPLKIAYLNLDKILQKSALTEQLTKRLEAEFGKRNDELAKMNADLRKKYEKFQKDSPVLSDEDRIKSQREISDMDLALQRKSRELQEDVNRRRNEGLSQIIEVADEAVRKIAKDQSYDFVLRSPLPYANPKYDITNEVIQYLSDYSQKQSQK
ncbi:MAG: OmpH family outer membrane protein [Alcaligenaceae bacterium]|nr:OmpH family outer membrane protein [Alcaligenaceae bacterium]